MPYPGEVLAGTYQVVDEIGKGGAGIIYRAYHLNLNKYVIVKKIKDNFVGILNARGEVDILKSLHHSYLPQVYDFLQIGQEIYTVMEYIEGYDLKHYIDAGYRFEEAALWTWLAQLADVLDYLHQHGILHMDIKPANIMLTTEGNICLIDFNISLAGEAESLTGISEAYASPEQYRKWTGILYETEDRNILLDVRTDIYSLGAVFYHLMTGYKPSPIASQMTDLAAFGLPYSKELAAIVARMVSFQRGKRYATAAKLRHAIQRAQRTKAEKYTLRAVFGFMLASVLVLSAVSGYILIGNGTHVNSKTVARIQSEELHLSELCQAGEYETAYREAVMFLNEEGTAIGRLQGARQSFLEKLVDACIGMEDYERADSYLQELLQLEKKEEYYRYQAVTAAYKGDFRKAEESLEEAERLGADSQTLGKCRAEMYAAQGMYASALNEYMEIYNEQSGVPVLRRMAALALHASADNTSYLEQAVSYYEQILASGMSSYADKMNLVTAYVKTGWNEKAVGVLQGMLVDYPEQYQVPLELGILKYNSELQKAPADRNFSQVKEYAAKSEKLFKEGHYEQDEQLEGFLRIVSELQ